MSEDRLNRPPKYEFKRITYHWGDIDSHQDKPTTGAHELFKAVFKRALNDLTWDKGFDDSQMLYLYQAHEFITKPNPVFRLCCEVMSLAESQIRQLREFAEGIFKANYKPPVVKEWKRRGRKPKGYREQLAAEMNKNAKA